MNVINFIKILSYSSNNLDIYVKNVIINSKFIKHKFNDNYVNVILFTYFKKFLLL